MYMLQLSKTELHGALAAIEALPKPWPRNVVGAYNALSIALERPTARHMFPVALGTVQEIDGHKYKVVDNSNAVLVTSERAA